MWVRLLEQYLRFDIKLVLSGRDLTCSGLKLETSIGFIWNYLDFLWQTQNFTWTCPEWLKTRFLLVLKYLRRVLQRIHTPSSPSDPQSIVYLGSMVAMFHAHAHAPLLLLLLLSIRGIANQWKRCILPPAVLEYIESWNLCLGPDHKAQCKHRPTGEWSTPSVSTTLDWQTYFEMT